MIRAAILLVALPFMQMGTDEGKPAKPKDAPPAVQGTALATEFKGRAGEPILLTVAAPGPVGWYAQTPGLSFTPPALLKDTRSTAAFAPAGIYRVIVVTGEKDANGIPVAPLATTITVEGGK